MRNFLFILLLGLGCRPATAQTDDEQVLVFRNTGEVNLLYSNEIDSIVHSPFDCDSVEHPTFVSQVFYTKDTTLVVPIEEIDSVAFGARNSMEYRADVRRLHEEPVATYILRFDGTAVYFRADTPSDLLPRIGDRLFYGAADERFPYGLTAKVNDVKPVNGEIAVSLTEVPLTEIFSRYFFAGTVRPSQAAPIRRATADPVRMNHEIDLEDFGSLSLFGTLDAPMRFVINPWGDYYHMECNLSGSMGFEYKMACRKTEMERESPTLWASLPVTVAGVLVPRLRVSGFVSLKAEVDFRYAMQRLLRQKISWTQRNGNHEWQVQESPTPASDTDEAQCELLLNGELFAGIQAEFQMALLGNVAGARAQLRLGPEVSGEINTGLLAKLRTYDPDIYAQGVLEMNWRLGLNTFLFTRSWAWGEENVWPVTQTDWRLNRRQIQLFPEYRATRAIQALRAAEGAGQRPVSVVTRNETPLAYKLESGFELTKEDGTVVDSVFSDTLQARTEAAQNITDELTVANALADSPEHPLYVQPVFHYAGYTVRAQSKPVLSDCLIQPITAFHTNGTASGISGVPIIDLTRTAETNWHIGPYLPVAVKDTTCERQPPFTGSYITELAEDKLTGTWEGPFGNETVRLSFAIDGTGRYTGLSSRTSYAFDYKTNTPQSGQITWYGDNGTALTCTVVSVTEDELRLRLLNYPNTFILNKY